MHNNFIPELLKEKIIYFFRYLYAFFLTGIAIFIILSLASFSIADNSFLVKKEEFIQSNKTNLIVKNLLKQNIKKPNLKQLKALK